MARIIEVNTICPFCSKHVSNIKYRNKYEEDTEFLQTKRGLRQYFHRSCYMKNIEEQRKERIE